MFTRSAIAIVLLILVGYGVVEAIPLVSGPSLTLTSPTDGATIANGLVTIAGHARRVNALSLDGAPLLTDEHGDFSTGS